MQLKIHSEVLKKNISFCENYTKLEFPNNKFDFVIALGAVSYHNLRDVVKCLEEMQRVSKGKSFVNLASYNTKEEYWMLREWTVLGNCILMEKEWKEILKYVNYTGDYYFINSKTLNLKRK